MMRWRIRERIGEGERGSSKGTKVAARGGNCRYEERGYIMDSAKCDEWRALEGVWVDVGRKRNEPSEGIQG